MSLEANDVTKIAVNPKRGMYFLGDMSFDEEDRNLAYIDRQIETLRAWREWVEENGEMYG